jgi:putative flippase GtrA
MNQQLSIYVACVVVSSTANFVAQESFYWQWPHVQLAMLFGAAVALVVKYTLVRKYAFAFKPRNQTHEAKVFFVYGVWGVVTMALFWAIELGFHYFIFIPYSRQIGTVVGLLVCGYLKFVLDRDYVFNAKQNS